MKVTPAAAALVLRLPDLKSPEEIDNFIRLETVRAIKNGGRREIRALTSVLEILRGTLWAKSVNLPVM